MSAQSQHFRVLLGPMPPPQHLPPAEGTSRGVSTQESATCQAYERAQALTKLFQQITSSAGQTTSCLSSNMIHCFPQRCKYSFWTQGFSASSGSQFWVTEQAFLDSVPIPTRRWPYQGLPSPSKKIKLPFPHAQPVNWNQHFQVTSGISSCLNILERLSRSYILGPPPTHDAIVTTNTKCFFLVGNP